MYYYLFTADNSMFAGCEEYQVFKSSKKLTQLDVSLSCTLMAQDIQEGYSWMALQEYNEEDYETEEDYEMALEEAENNFFECIEWEWEEIPEEEVFEYVNDLDEIESWE